MSSIPRSRANRAITSCGPTLEVLEPRLMLAANVLITEFMAINDSTLADQDGDYADWIELHNAGDEAANLDGWFLTDDPDNLIRWQLPAVTLPADGYLVVFASGKDLDDPAGELHTNFKLSGSGEYLALVRPDGQTVAFDYPPVQQYADVSYGLLSGSVVYLSNPTPGGPNNAANWLAPPVISEFMAINRTTLTDQDGDYADWIELHNPGAEPVSLEGWFLTDNPNRLTKWQLPAVTLAADGYLVVFASGKDRDDPADELHTNFKLSGAGEYLALVQPDGQTVAFDYAPVQQSADVSYGLLDGSVVFLPNPTPGAPNDGSTTVAAPVLFGVDRGFYDEPFALELTTPTAGAQIYYTLDGTDPSASGGGRVLYSGPIQINGTSIVRAASFTGGQWGPSTTYSYIFLSNVLTQSNDQTHIGFPDVWHAGAGGSGIYDSEFRDADYEMDPKIVNDPVWGPQMIEALMSIPSMSLTLDPYDLWDPNDGIYPNSIQRASRNPKWEKASSLELIDPSGGEQFGVNAGARIMGELARWAAVNDKQSFRILFKSEYGPSKLVTDFFGGSSDVDRFDTIVMRAHWGNSFLLDETIPQRLGIGFGGGDPTKAQYLRDIYALDTFADTGNLSSRGRFVHLYLNGVYWGLYEVIERPDDSFNAEHLGGDKTEWTSMKGSVGDSWNPGVRRYVKNPEQNGMVREGDRSMWNWLFHTYFDADVNGINTTNRSTISDADLAVIEQYLDVDQFIDYMITLWTINRADFPRKNWYAAYRGGGPGLPPEMPIQFYVWDSEASLSGTSTPLDRWNEPTAANDTGPVRIYWRLITNESFRRRWADRVDELFARGGPLSAEAMVDRYLARADEIGMAIIAESARWGDSATLRVDNPVTKDDWVEHRDYLLNVWLPERPAITIEQMRSVGLVSPTLPPVLTPGGGLFTGQVPLSMTNPNGTGQIWFTLDGRDPRGPDGQVASYALSYPLADSIDRVWRYDDSGVDLGAAWREPDFDDSAWSVGTGKFGYGKGDETTLVSFGGDSQNKHITTYFRKALEIDGGVITGVSMIVDDGAVVYFNGQEILRYNMPDGPIDYNTVASTTIWGPAERTWLHFDIDPILLGAGPNVFAVEIHQDSPRGSDMGFDMTFRLEAVIGQDTRVFARVLDGSDWSLWTDEIFILDQTPTLAITEVNYHPAPPTEAEVAAGFRTRDFEFIEILNTGAADVAQVGAVLSGGVHLRVPAFTLGAGEYGLLVANVEAFEMRYGTGLTILGEYDGRLSNRGDRIILTASNGDVLADFTYSDRGDWPYRADGYGATLELATLDGDYNDPAAWRAGAEYLGTPGAPGLGPIVDVVVNEVLTNTTTPVVDAIELYNTTGAAIDISGWYLSDRSSDLTRFRIPDGTVLPAGGYIVFDEHDFNVPGDPGSFALSRAGEEVWLMAADADGNLTRFVDHVEFGPAFEHMTLGRYPNGAGDLTLMAEATLGHANAGPHVSPVVISEIHYHPGGVPGVDKADLEFIELHNHTDAPIALDWYDANGDGIRDSNESGWALIGEVEYVFPVGTTIPAGGYLIVVGFDPADAAQLAAFRQAHRTPLLAPGVDIVGGWSGELADGGASVQLGAADRLSGGDDAPPMVTMDRADYLDDAPWPAEAAGEGSSLHRTDPHAFGNFPTSWVAAPPTPGAPVTGYGQIKGDFNGDMIVDANDIDILFGVLRTGFQPLMFDLNGDGAVDKGDVDYLVETVLGTRYGDLNLDGRVDLDDFTIFRKHFGQVAGWAGGDMTGDRLVSLDDFVVLKRAFGAVGAAPAAMAVAAESRAVSVVDSAATAPSITDVTAPRAPANTTANDVLRLTRSRRLRRWAADTAGVVDALDVVSVVAPLR